MRFLGWALLCALLGWLAGSVFVGERAIERGPMAARDGAGRVY